MFKSSDISEFPIHKAVFDKNLYEIYKAVQAPEGFYMINQVDTHGNTPLKLALKLENEDVVKVLCDAGAEVKLRAHQTDESPLDFVLAKQNESMLRILTTALQKQKYNEWLEERQKLKENLLLIPDFSLEMKISIDSNLFFLFSSLVTSDKFNIYKKGSSVYIELVKGSSSLIKSFNNTNAILIKEVNDQMETFKITKNKVIDLVTDVNFNNLEDKMNQLKKKGYQEKLFHTKKFEVKHKMKTENISNYVCSKFSAKTEYVVLKNKLTKVPTVDFINLLFMDDFKDYFNSAKPVRQLTLRKLLSEEKQNVVVSNESQTKKQRLIMWVNDTFPLKLNHFLPLLKVLSFTSSEFNYLLTSLEEFQLPFSSFPIRTSFPLGLSFYGLITVGNFKSTVSNKISFDVPVFNESSFVSETRKKSIDSNFYDKYYRERNGKNGNNTESDENSETLEKYRILFETSVRENEEIVAYSSRNTLNFYSRKKSNDAAQLKRRIFETGSENKPKLRPIKTPRFVMALSSQVDLFK